MTLPPDPSGQNDAAPHERAAPVITDTGSYGRLPPAPAPDMSRFEGRTSGARSNIAWLAAVGFAFVAAIWLTTLSVSQATDPIVALPVQERGVAALTSIEELFELHADEIASASPGETGGIPVPGFLVPGVELTVAEAQSGDLELMRDALLARSAIAIYERGIQALQPLDGPLIETTTFSTAGGTRRVMELFSQTNHDRATRFLAPLAVVSLILAGIVLLLGRGFSRFSGLGLAMIGAATLVLIGTLLLKFAVAFIGSDGSALAEEFSSLVDTVAWTPGRNALIFAAAGAALLIPAWLMNFLFDRSFVRPAPIMDTPVIDTPPTFSN